MNIMGELLARPACALHNEITQTVGVPHETCGAAFKRLQFGSERERYPAPYGIGDRQRETGRFKGRATPQSNPAALLDQVPPAICNFEYGNPR